MSEIPFKIGRVHHADCLEAMRQMPGGPDARVTAIVCDPPYGLGEGFKDFGKVLYSTFFEVVFPDYKKLKAHLSDDREFPVPSNRSSLLAWMDRAIWEESRIGMPESSIYFNNRVVFWDEEVKDGDISTRVVPDPLLVKKLDPKAFEEGPDFFFNLRPCRNASFGDGATCGVTELGNGRFCVPIVIPLDSYFAGFLSTISPCDSGFLADIVGLLNDTLGKAETSAFVMTSRGTELRAMLSLDTGNGTMKLVPAFGTDKFDFVFELRCTEPVGTRSGTGSLSSMFEPVQIRIVGDSTNRAFSLCFHKSILSLIKKKYSGFMGKGWDHGVPGVAFWKEALRICKPGAPMFAFGGTRTHHRLMVAIEDAGWEIRDTLMWVTGQGLPKGHDISKAIDKAAGVEREVTGWKVEPDGRVMGTEPKASKRICNPTDKEDRKCGADNRTLAERKVVTAPSTDEAKKWDGWGTALKPAWEPIVLAMKSCEGTFAENASKHGVAGVCIDGARISGVVPKTTQGKSDSKYGGGKGFAPEGLQESNPSPLGRWPANVLFTHHPGCVLRGSKCVKVDGSGVAFGANKEEGADSGNQVFGKRNTDTKDTGYGPGDGTETVEDWDCHPDCPVRMLDEQSGELTSGAFDQASKKAENQIYGKHVAYANPKQYEASSGGASRFFYCAKASKEERGPGNAHPTVKPLEVMKWLVGLVRMPEGNLILDPFSGSGTTGFACEILKVPFIGFEMDEKWVKVSNRRIRSVTYGDVSVKEYKAGQRSLFEDIDDE